MRLYRKLARSRAASVGARAGCFWLALLCLVLVPTALAANRPSFRTDPDYLIDTWETEDGLPENSATAMVQAADGYLWFGSFEGLVRSDGVRFTVLNPANTPGLPSAGVVNVHVDNSGRLWVSTYGGLCVRSGDRWRTIGKDEDWAGDFVRSFSERANG